MTTPDTWLTVAEVADQLYVRQDTLRSWMRRGQGPNFYRLGDSLIRLRQGDVDSWMASRCVHSTGIPPTSPPLERPPARTEPASATSPPIDPHPARTAPAPPSSPKRYDLSARDAGRKLGICTETIKRFARTGSVPARKNMSGYWMFSEADIDAVIRQQAFGPDLPE